MRQHIFLAVVAVALVAGAARGAITSTGERQFFSRSCGPRDFLCVPFSYSCNETNGNCGSCNATADCRAPDLVCEDNTCRKETAAQKGFHYLSLLAMAGAIAVGSIAAVAGVGGGGILVPMFAACLGEDIAVCVALSQATITGQSLLTVLMKVRLPHPQHDRQLINWVLMTFWLPCSLAGTMAGNLIGKTVPDWFRIILLLLLLTYVMLRVVLKAISQRKADREQQAMVNDAPSAVNSTSTSQAPGSPNGKVPKPTTLPLRDIAPPASLLLICATFIPLAVVNYAMSERSHLIVCASDIYWSVFGGALVYNFAVTAGTRVQLKRIFLTMVTSDDAGVDDDRSLPFKWNMKTTFWFPIVAITAGGAASLLGIGGGLILGVLFLEAGLTPEEVSATSGAATLLVAAESLLQYIIQGVVPLEFGLMMFAGGIGGSICGFFLTREIKRRRMSYLIVVCLGTIMGGSMLALTAEGAYSTWHEWKNHEYLGFTGVCK
jgi:uncharacterized membrane protein YfcA